MTSPDPLQQLRRLDRSSSKFCDQLNNVLHGEEYNRRLKNIQDNDLAGLVDYLEEVLDDLDPSSSVFRKCLRELRRLCGTRMILPTSYLVSGSLRGVGSLPFAPGGSGDVYEGILDGTRVSIKRVQIYLKGDPETATKTLYREAVVWKHLTHPNIVPLLGVTSTPPQLISEWMISGLLAQHIKKNPDADRVALLSDIVRGLHYLHSRDVIHGDLKASSILVDHSGCARIADFGLATIAQNLGSIRSGSNDHGPTTRWIAPEIVRSDQLPYSKEADIFSFAMVMIEVFTGAVPFSNLPAVATTFAIIEGKRPPRPPHPTFTDELWTLMQRCWDQDHRLRPEASEVLKLLHDADPPAWKQLISDTLNPQERISLITKIFSEPNGLEMVTRLCGEYAQAFVDVVDEELDGLEPWIRERCLRYLCRICGRQSLIPKSLGVEVQYDRKEDSLYRGGFAEMWKGRYDGKEVVVKVLRMHPTSDFGIGERFCKEVITWKALRHPNVLPLIGATMTENRLTMVSEWMPSGNINGFVKAHPDVDHFKLLRGVARGLIHIHNAGMVHGDLKGTNILIDRNGHACLADFGLITVISDQSTYLSSCIGGGTIRWMSPELLDPGKFGFEESCPTKESDCYALGMVIYEVLSGRKPYALCKGSAIVRKVLDGERPKRPRGDEGKLLTDSIWRVVQLCWEPQPSGRPNAKAILSSLKGDPSTLRSVSDVDGDVEKGVDEDSDVTSSDSCPSIKGSGNGFLVPPRTLPRVGYSLSTSHSGNGISGPLQRGGSKEGFTGRSRRNARKIFGVIIRGFCGS